MAGDVEHPAIPLVEDALDYLANRIVLYAKCVQGTDPDFIPYPASWFNAGGFWDDEREWKSERKGKANGHSRVPAKIVGDALENHRALLPKDTAQ